MCAARVDLCAAWASAQLLGWLSGVAVAAAVAATATAKRIAQELGSPIGQDVGYQVRFADKTSNTASIKLMTDGILLAETQNDPLLKAYDTIIIDEAHERSLNIDFLLGYLREILPRRPDLKIIVTSATIDADRFAKHFESAKGPAPVIMVSGRTFPVEQRYRPFEESRDYGLNEAIADGVDELWQGNAAGDILVFLPGMGERISPSWAEWWVPRVSCPVYLNVVPNMETKTPPSLEAATFIDV